MMEFSLEQFLPCDLSEITQVVERLPLDGPETPIYLRRDTSIFEMHDGYLADGAFPSVQISNYNLLERIAQAPGTSLAQLDLSPEEINELEQYHRHGIIGHESSQAKLTTRFVDGKYRAQYEGMDTTWFFHVPQKMEVDITTQCNFKCIHCGRDASPGKQQGTMRLEDYIELIERAADIGVTSLTVMGGEPTSHPEFIELALMARVAGIRDLSTSTNGWLVDEAMAEKMVQLFSSVQVSIHGCSAQTHDAIVSRPGAFERAKNAVRLLLKHGVKSLNTSFTVMRLNAQEMAGMVNLSRELGVPNMRFLVLSPEGRALDMDMWSDEERENLAELIGDWRRGQCGSMEITAGGFPPYDGISTSSAYYGCPAGRSLLYVDAFGKAKPCHCTSMELGDVRDTPLLDLWHQPALMDIRKRLTCCNYSEVCSGGCLGNSLWADKFQS